MSRAAHAVADTSVLLTFASVDRLDLLEAVFERIEIPPTIQREVSAKNFRPNALLIAALDRGTTWGRVDLPIAAETLAARYEASVDRGEAEAIALGKTWNRPVLIDDLAARGLACREGVGVVGSLGILSACKTAGVISLVKPIAEAMREAGRFFSPALLREFYRRVGEP